MSRWCVAALLLCLAGWLWSPPRAAARTGILDIESQPTGASVWLNGRRVGHTPYYDPFAALGRYQLRLHLEGYREYMEEVEIDELEGVSRRVILGLGASRLAGGGFGAVVQSAETGSAVIASLPKGAEIFIDGMRIETPAPFSRRVVEAGRYSAVARLGGRELAAEFEVEKGLTAKIVFDFTRSLVVDEGAADKLREREAQAEASVREKNAAAAAKLAEQAGVASRRQAEEEARQVRLRAEEEATLAGREAEERARVAREIEEAARREEENRARALERARETAREMAARDAQRAREKLEREQAEQRGRDQLWKERSEEMERERVRRQNEERERLAEEIKKRIMPALVLVRGGELESGTAGGGAPRRAAVRDFYLSRYEVTQSQWREVMGTTPWKGYRRDCDDCPATNLADREGGDKWAPVREFLKRLGEMTGLQLRLPTEDEWEWAAGSGPRRYRWSWGSDLPAGRRGGNVADESWARQQFQGGSPRFEGYDDGFSILAPVGSFEPNEIGLYDMTGNVWELVAGSGEGAAGLVMRGGSFDSGPEEAAVATRRQGLHPMEAGLRLAVDAR